MNLSPEDELIAFRQAAQQVVHDVNNALGPVLGFAELLLDEEAILLDTAKAQHFLTLIRDGTNDALARLSSLREYYLRTD